MEAAVKSLPAIAQMRKLSMLDFMAGTYLWHNTMDSKPQPGPVTASSSSIK